MGHGLRIFGESEVFFIIIFFHPKLFLAQVKSQNTLPVVWLGCQGTTALLGMIWKNETFMLSVQSQWRSGRIFF